MFYMLSTSRSFFEIPLDILFVVIAFKPNLSGLFRGSFGGGGGIKLPPCLTLVRIMLETSNVARKYTPLFSFRKCTL